MNKLGGKNMSSNRFELLVHGAVEVFERVTGLRARIRRAEASAHGGCVRIDTTDGRSFTLPYEVKPTMDRRDQLLAFEARHGDALLITRQLSAVMAEQCRTLGVQFIDQAGNCFIRQPGLLVLVMGGKETTKSEQGMARGLTPATLRVVFAVLARPTILHGNVRQIAEVASVSHGAAGAALILLEEMGLLTRTRAGRRLLAMPERWLDTWTEGYLGRIRPKLERYRMTAPLDLNVLLQRVSSKMGEVALGGEAAAAYLNLGLKPGAITLYVKLGDPNVTRELVRNLKLRRDPDGKIELVNMFWNTNELPCFPVVPDALIYADLVGTGEQRAMETAAHLKEKICAYVASEAE